MTDAVKAEWLRLLASKAFGFKKAHYDEKDIYQPDSIFDCDLCQTQENVKLYAYRSTSYLNLCNKHGHELDVFW